jgi:hypothetical protein
MLTGMGDEGRRAVIVRCLRRGRKICEGIGEKGGELIPNEHRQMRAGRKRELECGEDD